MKCFFTISFVVIVVLAIFFGLLDLMMMGAGDRDEFIRNNIRNPRVAKEILRDSICNVDTASSNSNNYIDKYISDYPFHLDLKEINNFYKFETSNYECVVIHQNYKKFSHDEKTMLFVKNSEGKFIIYDNRVSDKLKIQILLKVHKKYVEMSKKPDSTTPTNIKMK